MNMEIIYKFVNNKNFKVAFPFLIFVIGGSLGLREFTSLRYKYREINDYNPKDEAKKLGITLKKTEDLTLESQYTELQKVDIHKWMNIRIPRLVD